MTDYVVNSIAAYEALTLAPGDRVLFQSGTYLPTDRIDFLASGTAGNPIIYGAEDPDNPPFFDFTNAVDTVGWWANDLAHITVQDWRIENADRSGMRFRINTVGPQGVTVQRITASNNGTNGVWFSESIATWTGGTDHDDVLIQDIHGDNNGSAIASISSANCNGAIIRRVTGTGNGYNPAVNAAWGVLIDGAADNSPVITNVGTDLYQVSISPSGRQVESVLNWGTNETVYHYDEGTFGSLNHYQWAKSGDTLQISSPFDLTDDTIYTINIVWSHARDCIIEYCDVSDQGGMDGVCIGFDKGCINPVLRYNKGSNSQAGMSINTCVNPSVYGNTAEACALRGGMRINRPRGTVFYCNNTAINCEPGLLYFRCPTDSQAIIKNNVARDCAVGFDSAANGMLGSINFDYAHVHNNTVDYSNWFSTPVNERTGDPLLVAGGFEPTPGSPLWRSGTWLPEVGQGINGLAFERYAGNAMDLGAYARGGADKAISFRPSGLSRLREALQEIITTTGIYFGGTEISAGQLKIGGADIASVYWGSTFIWPPGPPPITSGLFVTQGGDQLVTQGGDRLITQGQVPAPSGVYRLDPADFPTASLVNIFTPANYLDNYSGGTNGPQCFWDATTDPLRGGAPYMVHPSNASANGSGDIAWGGIHARSQTTVCIAFRFKCNQAFIDSGGYIANGGDSSASPKVAIFHERGSTFQTEEFTPRNRVYRGDWEWYSRASAGKISWDSSDGLPSNEFDYQPGGTSAAIRNNPDEFYWPLCEFQNDIWVSKVYRFSRLDSATPTDKRAECWLYHEGGAAPWADVWMKVLDMTMDSGNHVTELDSLFLTLYCTGMSSSIAKSPYRGYYQDVVMDNSDFVSTFGVDTGPFAPKTKLTAAQGTGKRGFGPGFGSVTTATYEGQTFEEMSISTANLSVLRFAGGAQVAGVTQIDWQFGGNPKSMRPHVWNAGNGQYEYQYAGSIPYDWLGTQLGFQMDIHMYNDGEPPNGIVPGPNWPQP